MNRLVPYIWVAGSVHLLLFISGFFLPRKLQFQENLSRVAPIIRQIFVVHSVYISTLLLFLGILCLLFAPELAGGSMLGKFFSGYLAVFWGARILIQLFYYDPELKKENPFANVVFLLAFIFLSGVFTISVLGIVK